MKSDFPVFLGRWGKNKGMPGGLETKKCISNIIYIEIFNIYERLLGRALLLCVSIKASGGSAFPDKCEQGASVDVWDWCLEWIKNGSTPQSGKDG